MRDAVSRKPSTATSWTASAVLVATWAVLRLAIFRPFVFPLTYALPLLLCVWTRDKIALWMMAGVFAVMHTLQQFAVLPSEALPRNGDGATWAASLINIFVAAVAVHAATLPSLPAC